MILGVNGLRLQGRVSGVGRAIEAILDELDRAQHPFDEIRVYSPEPIDLKPGSKAINVVLPSRLSPGWWEQLVLSQARQDLLLCPSYTAPLMARSPTLLIHHGSYEGYPQAFPFLPRTRARIVYTLSAHAATAVSTVSEHSKRDIIRFYGVDANKISVIPEGVDTKLFRKLADEEAVRSWRISLLGEDVPMLLYVGKPAKRRNLPALIRAFGELKQRDGIPHKLVLIGAALAGTPFGPAVEALGLQDDVVAVPYASHEDMVLAYNAAEILVYPTSYEGFGMPVLEAMACGTPAVALDNTALPEFAGGVALLLPDAEVGTLREALGALIADPARRAEMAMLGPRRASAYDWKPITEQYIGVMNGILGL
ncbi:glycosyltransferase family 1 protein [Phenylobacterium sp.]|uniref:glycosyltransferase family 4 protein n=1 Tax=Phenylobacterium sp. TaxID=1871053 RepID=UPI0027340B06|nr:glycosyltransferase family 1 protein [Phenylobacterium sp.]MDP3659111.1 glycosyltransferase family 1 protein [Phenylobacterium sp.]